MTDDGRAAARKLCDVCRASRPVCVRPAVPAFPGADGIVDASTRLPASRLCKSCFLSDFEGRVHACISHFRMFRPGQTVAIGASGGKDSTVLAYVLHTLNAAHGYDLKLSLVSVDEGIAGYRDVSLSAVTAAGDALHLPVTVLSHDALFGYSMDAVASAIGSRSKCTFCGVFRRSALDRAAASVGADVIATGHNADDCSETVLMNLLRGDIARLARSSSVHSSEGGSSMLPRAKPLMWVREKDIVLYAYHRRLEYHSRECSYAPAAYRGVAREYLKDLERCNPRVAYDIMLSASTWRADDAPHASAATAGDDAASVASSLRSSASKGKLSTQQRVMSSCTLCGYMTSSKDGVCQACNLVRGLRDGTPMAALGLKDT